MPRIITFYFRAAGVGQVSRAFRSISGEAESTAAKVGRASMGIGRTMVGMAVPLIAVGAESAKMAITFDQAMTRIQTQAGASGAEVNKFSQQVLQMAASGKVQQGPTQLANALFHLRSVGLTSTTAMKALKVSMDGAAVGGSDAEATASALGAAMVTTHTPANKLTQLMGLLNATVGAGNMRMQDLVGALSRGMIPAFQQVGLTIKDAMGSLDVLTDSGYNASSASSQLSTALHFLSNPTAKAQKQLALIGMSAYQMGQDMHKPNGLLVALKDLKSHLLALPGGLGGQQAEQVLGALLPGGRGRVMLTMLQNLDRYSNKLTQLGQKSGQFPKDVAIQHQTAAFKIHAAWSQIQASMIQFGGTLLPIIGQYLPKLVKLVTGAFGWFTHLSKGTQRFLVVLTLLTGTVGIALIAIAKLIAAVEAISAAWAALTAISIASEAIISATVIGAIIVALVLLITHFNLVKKAVVAAFKWIETAASNVWNWIKKHWPLLVAILISPFLVAVFAVIKFHKQILHALGAVWQWIKGNWKLLLAILLAPFTLGASLIFHFFPRQIKSALEAVLKFIWTMAKKILDALTWPFKHAGKVVKGALGVGSKILHAATFGILHEGGVVKPRYFSTGGPVGSDNILGWLQAGEGVLSRSAMSMIGGEAGLAAANRGEMGGQHITIQPGNTYLVVDGRVLGRAITRYALRTAARGPATLTGGNLVVGATSPVPRSR